MSSDASTIDFWRQVSLLFKRLAEITLYNSFDERHEFASEMVARFFRHFCREMIYTVEQNVAVNHVADLFFEFTIVGVVQEEGFFNTGKSTCKANRSFVVC